MRANISAQSAHAAALKAAENLKNHPVFQANRHIACYCSYGSEFNTTPIIESIWQAEKICYLPVLTDAKTLHFVQYKKGDELQPNQHMIPEPVDHHHIIHPEKLDLVIVPLVAFDMTGNRIGTGGGYYDRTFAFMYSNPSKEPFLLGLGYEMQMCEHIKPEAWDIRLNGVLSEKELMLCSQ